MFLVIAIINILNFKSGYECYPELRVSSKLARWKSSQGDYCVRAGLVPASQSWCVGVKGGKVGWRWCWWNKVIRIRNVWLLFFLCNVSWFFLQELIYIYSMVSRLAHAHEQWPICLVNVYMYTL